MIYVLDHYHATDHLDYCRIVQTDKKDEHEVAELISAIQLFFEQDVDASGSPTMDDMVNLLVKHFGFKTMNKDAYGNQLWEIMNYMADVEYSNFEPFTFQDGIYVYIDIYEARDMYCSPTKYPKLFIKWLNNEVRDEIRKLPCA